MASPLKLILADDDDDDCLLFSEALKDIDTPAVLDVVNNGEELMRFLEKIEDNLPEVLFLDLNMPRKSGYDCLPLIKANNKLAGLKIIIYSTSLDRARLDFFYTQGANYYLQKPIEYSKLKLAISTALNLVSGGNNVVVPRDKFVITV